MNKATVFVFVLSYVGGFFAMHPGRKYPTRPTPDSHEKQALLSTLNPDDLHRRLVIFQAEYAAASTQRERDNLIAEFRDSLDRRRREVARSIDTVLERGETLGVINDTADHLVRNDRLRKAILFYKQDPYGFRVVDIYEFYDAVVRKCGEARNDVEREKIKDAALEELTRRKQEADMETLRLMREAGYGTLPENTDALVYNVQQLPQERRFKEYNKKRWCGLCALFSRICNKR